VQAAPEDDDRGTVTGVLSRDHRRLVAPVAHAKRALAAGAPALGAERFAAFRDGLERHMVAEEEVLFPAFESLTGMAAGPTQVMRNEHEQMRHLLGAIAARLDQEAEAPAHTTPLAELTALLYAHNGKEERILYPTTDRAASAAGTLESLVEKLAL